MTHTARSVWTRAVAGIPAVALAVSGLSVAPQDVQAQTTAPTIGQCVAPAALQNDLRGQEQKFMVTGTQSGVFLNSKNQKMPFNLGISFTSKPDGTVGYIIQECRDDFGKATGQSKAQKKIINVRVYPDTLNKPLPEMFVKTTNSQADKGCEQWDVGTCGSHNGLLNTSYKNGFRIVLQGYDPEAGQIISVSKKGADALIIATDTSTGSSTTMTRMINADYSTFVKNAGYNIPPLAQVPATGTPVAALTSQSSILALNK